MPKKAKELSAAEVRRLTKPGLHAVGGVAGLLLNVKPTGARSWILRVKVGSKRRDIGLGGFPDVPLSSARDRAREAREKIWTGVDPVAERRAAQHALRAAQVKELTFTQAAKQCHDAKRHEYRSEKHRKDWISSLERHALPVIGDLPVAAVDLAHVLRVLEPIWLTRTETATRVRQRLETVLTWATVGGYRKGENPARWRGNLDAVLPKPNKVRKVTHLAALPYQEVPAFMADLRKREGMGARALEFAILTAARSGEVRKSKWEEFDLAGKVWTIPAERMKANKVHRVPLSADAVRLLENLPRIHGSEYVFTAARGGPVSDMTLSAVCKRMEVEAVPHGFRSSFKDWARTSTAYPDEVSELALAHVSTDATRAAYARDELLPQRARLMRDWGKFCRTVQKAGEVVPMRAEA